MILSVKKAADLCGLDVRRVYWAIEKGYINEVPPGAIPGLDVDKKLVKLSDVQNYKDNPPKRGPKPR